MPACPYPGCSFSTDHSTHFATHCRTHTKEKPFVCSHPGCDAAYGDKSNLRRHEEKHCDVEYRCTFPGCTRIFGSQYNRARHWHNLHSSCLVSCPDCGEQFKNASYLAKHCKTKHEINPELRCKYGGCNHTTNSVSNLTKHCKNVHQARRPFKCTFPGCPAAFKQGGNLRVHSLIHTDSKPYVCSFPGCEDSFRQAGHLVVHERTHTDDRPYKCQHPGCPYAATMKHSLEQHQLQHSESFVKRKRAEEDRIMALLTREGISYIPNKQISLRSSGGTYREIDSVIPTESGVIHLEIGETCAFVISCTYLCVDKQEHVCFGIDENQHKPGNYSIEGEVEKMIAVHAKCLHMGDSRPLLVIRFNPHTFRKGPEWIRVSRSNVAEAEKERCRREKQLLHIIAQAESYYGPPGSLRVLYMYYDCSLSSQAYTLDIWQHDAFTAEVRNTCLNPIV